MVFLEELGIDASLMFQILLKNLGQYQSWKKTEMQQSNLISSVTKGQSPFLSLQGLGDQLQASWEAGSCIYLVFLDPTTYGFSCMFVKERKETTATDLLWKLSTLGCQ